MLVFLSHSTRPDTPRDKEYLDAVENALTACGDEFTVLLDRKSLEGGQEWPRELAVYMMRCHAAVILFSRNALKHSNWVLKESFNLDWRRTLEPGFLLLPVVLEGVRKEEVLEDPRFAASGLGRWQFLEPGTPDEVASQVVMQCRAHAPLRKKTPMDKLVTRLTGVMERLSRAELESSAQTLGIPFPEWDTRAPGALANEFARRLVRTELEHMHDWVKELAQALGRSQAAQLIKDIRALWVNPEAASRIPPAAGHVEDPWAIGLNGERLLDFTARCYLERAYWSDPSIHLIPVDSAVGQRTVEELESQIRNYLLLRFDLQLQDQDGFLRKTKERFFVLMPEPVPEKDTLNRLRNRFPQITFFVTTGRAGHDDPRIKDHHRLLTLEPCLDLSLESEAWVLHKSLEMMLRNIEG